MRGSDVLTKQLVEYLQSTAATQLALPTSWGV